MRGSVSAKELARLITAARSVIETRSTIPVLLCVRLSCADGLLSVEATNLDQSVQLSMPTPEMEDGIAIIDPQRMLPVLSAISGDVRLERRDQILSVSAGRTRASIICEPAGNWPQRAVLKGNDAVTLDAAAIKRLSSLTTLTYQGADSPAFEGVHIDWADGWLIAEASNRAVGSRKTLVEVTRPSWLKEARDLILPRPLLAIITATACEAPVRFSVAGGQAVVVGNGVEILSKTIDAKFISLRRVIDAHNGFRPIMRMDRASLKRAITAATKFSLANEREPGAVLSATALYAFARNGEMLTVPVDGEQLDSRPPYIEFNIRHLAAIIGADDSETVELAISDGRLLDFRGTEGVLCIGAHLHNQPWKTQAVDAALREIKEAA